MDNSHPEGTLLLVNGAHGIYVPLVFATQYEKPLRDSDAVTAEDVEVLLGDGQNGEHYWETWDHVMQNFTLVVEGREFFLFQDGDLWALPLDA